MKKLFESNDIIGQAEVTNLIIAVAGCLIAVAFLLLAGCSLRATASIETGDATEGITMNQKNQRGFPPNDANEVSTVVNALSNLFSFGSSTPQPVAVSPVLPTTTGVTK